MSIAKLASLTTITRPSTHKRSDRLKWLLFGGSFCLLLLFGLRQSGDSIDAARMRWEASQITDYRIKIEFVLPYRTCEQDFEVRSGQVTYRHRDTCTSGLSATSGQAYMLTIEDWFERLEREMADPGCGDNGCACDGPIKILVNYEESLGYPTEIRYQLQPEMRWRYPEFWGNLLSGHVCPPTTYVGQTIRITSLARLKPVAPLLPPLPTDTLTPTLIPKDLDGTNS